MTDQLTGEALVSHLVSLHGEDGICPSAEDWRRILAHPQDAPLCILNLLKFTEGGADGPGARAYGTYGRQVGPAFLRAGGKRLFFGAVGHIFPAATAEDWDAAILTRYPSPRALAGMWLDAEFVAAHEHRIDGVARSCVLVLSEGS